MVMKNYDIKGWGQDSSGTTVLASHRFLTGVVTSTGKKPVGMMVINPHVYYKYDCGPGLTRTIFKTGSSCKLVTSLYSSPANPVYDPDNFFLSGDAQIPLSRLQDEALMKLYEQIRGSSNLIVDAAEGRQTIAMIKKALSFKKLLKEFLKEVVGSKRYKRIKSDSKRSEYVSSKWLEYRYGWQPLLSSIYDLAENIHRHRTEGLLLVKARRGGNFSSKTFTGDGSYSKPFREFRVDFSRRYEIGVLFKFPAGNNISDFTRLNPLSIAWELTTLSFVADWFLNIGQQLELWENYVLFSSNFQTGYETVSARELRSLRSVGYTSSPLAYSGDGLCILSYTYFSSSDNFGTSRSTGMRRAKLLSLPRPAGFRVHSNMNAKRFLDTAALIRQMVSRK